MLLRPIHRKDFGIRAMIAPSFGEIFKANSMQNGMLPVVLSPEECEMLAEDAKAGLELEVDLEKEEVRRSNGQPSIKFTTEPFRRHCLLNGLDDISLTLLKEADIEAFEDRRSKTWPWLDGLGYTSGGKLEAKAVKERKRMDW
jgi:3-isopropylmalate dehydratase